MTDYEILKSYGFSPAKIGEILLDVKRGDNYANLALAVAKLSAAVSEAKGVMAKVKGGEA
jgi:hypothetical protein